MRKPPDFMVRGNPPYQDVTTFAAWCSRNYDTGKREWATDFVCEMTLKDAIRLQAWLKKAIAWMEGEEARK